MKPRLLRPRSAPERTAARGRRRLVGAAAAGVLALTGCQVMSPMTTNLMYDPSDGISVDMGTVEVLNLLVVAPAEGEPGVLSGQVVNPGPEPVVLSITAGAGGGQPVQVEVPARGTLSLGTSSEDGQEPVVIDPVEAIPGSLLTVSIGAAQAGVHQAEVPVLLPQGPYETVTPPS